MERFLWNLLLYMLALPAGDAAGRGARSSVPVRVVSGAYWSPLPSMTAYESSVPLVYAVEWLTPSTWAATRPQLSPSLCPHDPFCGLAKDLDELNSLYWQQVETAVNVSTFVDFEGRIILPENTSRAKRGIEFFGQVFSWCCDVVTASQLQPLADQQLSVVEQLKAMHSIVSADHAVLTERTKALEDYNGQVVDNFKTLQDKMQKMELGVDKIKNSIKATFGEINNELYALFISNIVNLRHLGLGLDLLKRNEVILQCHEGRLPPSVLPPNVLLVDLQKISGTKGMSASYF